MESVAALLYFASVLMAVRGRVLTWPVSFVASGLYLVIFLQEGFYASCVLQVIFLFQTVYGWWCWGKETVQVGWCSRKERVVLGTTLVVLYPILSMILSWGGGSLPWLDGGATVLSLVALYLLGRRKVEAWICWVGVDAIYVALFVMGGLYVSTLLYLVLLTLSIKGFILWKRKTIITD